MNLILLSCLIFTLAILTSAGIINGWISLQHLLIQEGQLQPNDIQLQLIPAIASIAASLSTVIYGFLVDQYNLKWTAVSANALFTLGVFLLAVSDHQSFNAFGIGFCLLAIGGMGSILTLYHFAYLYNNPILIRSIINACYSLAGLLLFLFFQISSNRSFIFLPYASVCCLCTCFVTYCFPNQPCTRKENIMDMKQEQEQEQEQEEKKEDNEEISSSSDDIDLSDQCDKINQAIEEQVSIAAISPPTITTSILVIPKERIRSFKTELLDPQTIGLGLYFAIGLTINVWFASTIQEQLLWIGDETGIWGTSYVIISACLPIGVAFTLPLHLHQFYYSGTISISIILCSLSFLPILISSSLPLQLIGFLLNTYARSLLTNVVYCYSAQFYLPRYYGSIIGFVTFMTIPPGLILILLDTLISTWSKEMYFLVNLLLSLLNLPLLVYPLYLYVYDVETAFQ